MFDCINWYVVNLHIIIIVVIIVIINMRIADAFGEVHFAENPL